MPIPDPSDPRSPPCLGAGGPAGSCGSAAPVALLLPVLLELHRHQRQVLAPAHAANASNICQSSGTWALRACMALGRSCCVPALRYGVTQLWEGSGYDGTCMGRVDHHQVGSNVQGRLLRCCLTLGQADDHANHAQPCHAVAVACLVKRSRRS